MANVKCELSKTNLKVFSRAVQALAKLGSELFMEANEDGLTLRTVTSARSAYAAYAFVPDFFDSFNVMIGNEAGTSSGDNVPEAILCKIHMKNALVVFKSQTALDKSVELCTIEVLVDQNLMNIKLELKQEVTRCYSYKLLDCTEEYQPILHKEMQDNVLMVQAKVLMDFCSNISADTEEITLIPEPGVLLMRNYLEDYQDSNRVVKTEIRINSGDFMKYTILRSDDVSFSLRDFRAALTFADSLNIPVTLYLDRTGKPMSCSMESEPKFTADFILSTLAPPETQSQENQPIKTHTQQLHNMTPPVKRTQPSESPIREMEQLSSPVQADNNIVSPMTRSPELEEINPDEDEDILPGTPPKKKFRSVFLGLSQNTFHASQVNMGAVLAEDSDHEDN